MRTTTITAIVAFVVAMTTMTASAQIPQEPWDRAVNPEYEMSVWINDRTYQGFMVVSMPMDTSRDAKVAASLIDADDIERNFDAVVVHEDETNDLALFGFGPVSMFAGVIDGMGMIVLATSHGSDLLLFAAIAPNMDDIDTDTYANWVKRVGTEGASASPGIGYTLLVSESTIEHRI